MKLIFLQMIYFQIEREGTFERQGKYNNNIINFIDIHRHLIANWFDLNLGE